ncbi:MULTISPECIES: hypothetical protein [Pseudomonas syringae group]|uniref:Uncharacterized protein n=1 Tax=Pseudomonas cichorii TaxID=36746 RepID=A0ABQ1DPM3_PSECI|nr:hypothetical protein [Pseudomonas cichorii]AHF68158.1 hypothetical protein PCH70_30050 [Pseudomonas cichorii JBC1]QVE15199.1 hypothetical protein KGD89_14920 [Pseudomonas cichorii]SDO27249.1 hypothetical protein SAMN05216599_10784 [Pseudomonas cichorii]GFM68994.1 hypothetical protein PSCICJ_51120 [Pseudomonas cichorii]GFM92941.1 hypothetical protein PSCICP_29130 [Pseudomonas cichorii]
MANSLNSLLQKIKGRTNTLGWGAIVSFNRTKANHLLAQQHIARFSTDSFLPAIRGTVQLEGPETLELSGIILSAPRLSFENASLKDSRARLNMDIVGGTVTHYSNAPGSPTRALSSFNISEQHGYRLNADIELRKVVGGINKSSHVILDISKATEFTSNLIDLGASPTLIGDFFKARFDELPAEQQIYSLGLLDFNADDLLAPKDFYILTQAAPEGKNLKSDSYGDGAVVLFVRTKNNFYDGTLPTSESTFPYLIPDDKVTGEERSKYSGSLLISRQAVMYWFIMPYIKQHIGKGLNFEVKDDDQQTGDYQLVAVAGEYPAEPIDIQYQHANHHLHFIKDDLRFKFSQKLSLIVRSDFRLELKWVGTSNEVFHFWDDIAGWWDEHRDALVGFEHEVSIIFDNQLNASNNTITFVQSPLSSYKATVTAPDALHEKLKIKVQEVLEGILKELLDLFKSIDIPEINFFGINHLLFPEHNALILKEAYLPGDLALFGEVDPALTSFSLNPLYVTVKTGDTLQFEIVELRYRARAANITWSVRDIDGSRSQGVITTGGLFTAPSVGQLEDTTARNVVTATYTDPQSQETRTASALVVIVSSSMAMTPALHAIDLRAPRNVTFKVSTLTGNTVTWTALPPEQGTITGNGKEATYTPPATLPSGKFMPVTVEAIDSVTKARCPGTVLLVNGVMPMDVKPAFHPGLAPDASLHMSLPGQLADVLAVQWSVATGEGSIDATGNFKAPATITQPYTVIQGSYFDGVGTQSGYGVIHLSEIAPRAKWVRLEDFTIKEQSGSVKLFANGLEQIKVRVAVKPFDDQNTEVTLTPSELNSMRLIVADTLNELPYIGEEGVPADTPEGKEWGVNESRNAYLYYPPDAPLPPEPQALDGSGKSLYIQTRSPIPLKIAVALTRADQAEFNSTEQNGSEEKHNIIEITPRTVPTYAIESYEFEHIRVVGGADNDYELNTIDYYYLRFKQSTQNIKFVTVAFDGPASMTQWESRQYAELMGSYTGYALPGSRTLLFEPLLMQSIAPELRPSLDVIAGHEAPEGALLISLHRRSDFLFDNESGFVQPMKLKLIDEYGNQHKITVGFNSPTDRNTLKITATN